MSAVYVDGRRSAELGLGLPALAQPAAASDVVVHVDDDATVVNLLPALVTQAVATLPPGPGRVEFLDSEGQQLGVHVSRGADGLPPHAWLIDVVPGTDYQPRAHQAEAEQYRDRIGDRLLRPEQVEPGKQHLISDDRRRADRVLALEHGSPLLDVGCSDGTLLIEAVRHWNVAEAVGADVATSALDEARSAIADDAGLSGRLRFVESFIEDLDFPTGHFSTVTACETLEHVGQGQLGRAVANLVRMLRPGGEMIVTVPNRFPHPRYEQDARARWAWPAHHQFYTQASLARLLAPSFATLEFLAHHDGDDPGNGIYLIAVARGRV